MNKVYFAKMNNREEIENRTFTARNDKLLGGIEKGDYVFVKPANGKISELWLAKNFLIDPKSNEKTVVFELACKLDRELDLTSEFVALKFFKLDLNLLNKIIKPNSGICFWLLQLMPFSIEIIKNSNKLNDYINNDKNYRKIQIRDTFNNVYFSSDDVQLVGSNGNYQLFEAAFISKDIFKRFNSDNFANGKTAGGAKGKLYKVIESGKKVITGYEGSLMGFYDLFFSDRIGPSKTIRKDFVDWVKKQGIGSARNYGSGINAIEKNYGVNIEEEFEKDGCRALLNKVTNDEAVISSKKTGVGNKQSWDSYLKKYIAYRNNGETVDEVSESVVEEGCDEINQQVMSELKEYLSLNTIFYGVPGCGKSYKINKLLHIDSESKKNGRALNDRFYKRILFHPEYTYSDFVGQIMPETNGERIEYKFQPGPFVECLKDTLKDKNNHYFLVIEEINRGNAPAIFGNIFQLLDRDDEGQSEYQVYDREIQNWLKANGVNLDKVFIPSNLTIFATMNTSDQNVFTLDTAFKRRWHLSRIRNDFNDTKDEFLNIKIVNKGYTWREFALSLNSDIIKNCNEGVFAEDKLLGTHFVKRYDLENEQIFAEKIFMYLWNDVVKYNKECLFRSDLRTLDEVIEKFVMGENVFNSNATKLLELHEKYLNKTSEETEVNTGNINEW